MRPRRLRPGTAPAVAVAPPAEDPSAAEPAAPRARPLPKFVFVVTYGRSGSTLVAGLLNTLPRTLVRGENGFYALDLFRAHRNAVAFANEHAEHRPRQVESAFYGSHLLSEEHLAGLERALMTGLLLGTRTRPRRLGFKEVLWHRIAPDETEAFFDWFEQVFPGARYVLHTRDPEAASTSGFWRSIDRDEALAAMSRVVEIHGFLRRTRPDRVLDTRYEVIVGDDRSASDATLTALATFVLGRCNDEILAEMRQVLEVGYGPRPFGASRAEVPGKEDAARG